LKKVFTVSWLNLVSRSRKKVSGLYLFFHRTILDLEVFKIVYKVEKKYFQKFGFFIFYLVSMHYLKTKMYHNHRQNIDSLIPGGI